MYEIEELDGNFTPEQEETCKEGNIRGVFGYPTSTEALSKKYRITPDKIDYILCKYGSMENYIAAYREDHLDNQDFKILGNNISNLQFDINQGFNPTYSNFYDTIFGKPIRNSGNLRFIDSAKMRKIIESRLSSPYLGVLLYRLGIYDGNNYTLEETAEMLGRPEFTRERIRAYESKAIRLLKSPICARKLDNIYDDSLLDVDLLTPDEKSERASLLDRIYGSNLIFVPDEEFAQEPDNITLSELQEIASELCAIKEDTLQRKNSQGISKKEPLSSSKTPLEQLRAQKQKLAQELTTLKAQSRSAEELLASYDNLLNDATLDNTKD